jgi:hypothetical protein
MRLTTVLLVLGVAGLPAGAGDSGPARTLVDDVKWLEGAWHLPRQKVTYKGKMVDGVPGFIVTLFPRPLYGAYGQINFSVDDTEEKFLDLFAQLRCDIEPVAKKGQRLLRLKESFGEAKREYAVRYEIKGKQLHLTFEGPVTLGAGDSTIKVNLSGVYQRYPRLVVAQDDTQRNPLDKRPAFFQKIVGKIGLSRRGPSTHHTSEEGEKGPGGRYLTATLLSADKDHYVFSFSGLDYWSAKTPAGGIQTFTHGAAGRVAVPVGKEVRTLGFKFHIED